MGVALAGFYRTKMDDAINKDYNLHGGIAIVTEKSGWCWTMLA